MYTLIITIDMNKTLTCSRECYVKYYTIPRYDCQNDFLKTTINPRCSPCYMVVKRMLEKHVLEEIWNLAKNINWKGGKKKI